MAFKQVITPNPEVPCTPGWCLTYVDDAFNLEAHGKTKNYRTALDAWGTSKSQHRDRNFPANCWVPVWFTLKNEPAGHVAILAPDGAVWSSSHPTKKQPVRHGSLNEIINYYGNLGLSYLGWTEDVGGVEVIRKEEDMALITEEQVKWHYRLIAGVEASPEEIKNYVGKDYVWATEEIKRYFANQGRGYNLYRSEAEKAITDLKKQLVSMPADTTEAELKLQAIKDALGIK